MYPDPRSPIVPIYPAPRGFVFHHSGGSTLQGLRATLMARGLGSEYLMDRDGTIYSFAGPGSSHIRPNDRYGGIAPGLTNANALGMEVVALDNGDVTPAQIASARKFIAQNYPDTPVYGHGEVNPGHKQADEGMAIVNAIRGDRARVAPTMRASTSSAGSSRIATLDHQIDAVSDVAGIPADLTRIIMQRESSGRADAVSDAGARGLMQIMPATFAGYSKRVEALTGRPADIDDPLDNLMAGALVLRDSLDATNGDVNAAARRYTGGPDPRNHGPRTIAYGNDVAKEFWGA